jgi:nitrogen regulatory protein PII
VIRHSASTGHHGDGILIVSDLTTVVNIRTGDCDRLALL